MVVTGGGQVVLVTGDHPAGAQLVGVSGVFRYPADQSGHTIEIGGGCRLIRRHTIPFASVQDVTLDADTRSGEAHHCIRSD
jgi:hypothetical protein